MEEETQKHQLANTMLIHKLNLNCFLFDKWYLIYLLYANNVVLDKMLNVNIC